MENNGPLSGRVSIDGLADVENFLEAAQHLKALKLQLAELQLRRSRREHALARQIECVTNQIEGTAKRSTRVRELWKQTQAELAGLDLAMIEAEHSRQVLHHRQDGPCVARADLCPQGEQP